MKINEAMQETKLTKKAINYYEEKGLISPTVNPENNYRIYNEREIERLKIISALRSFDFTVKSIKKAIDNEEDLKDILTNYVEKLNNKIMQLQRNKAIIDNTLDKLATPSMEIKDITKDMMNLKKFVEMDEKEREGFMEKSLIRIFPGVYGKYLALILNNFLQEPLNTEEKNKAWIHMVKVLDKSPSIKVTEDIKKYIEGFEEEDWSKVNKRFKCEINKTINTEITDDRFNFYNIDLKEKDLEKLKMLLNYFASEENIKVYAEIFKEIDEDLRVLSSLYRKFLKKQEEMDKSAKEYFENVEPCMEDRLYYENFDKNIKIFDDKNLPDKVCIALMEDSYFVGIELNNYINKKDLVSYVKDFKDNYSKGIKNKVCDHVYRITGIDTIEKYKDESKNFSNILAYKVKSLKDIPNGLKKWHVEKNYYIVCSHKVNEKNYFETFNYVYIKFLKEHNLEVKTFINIDIYTNEKKYFLICLHIKN